MEPIILRRTKDMKDENGEFIVKLNKKTVNIEYLTLKSDERGIVSVYRNKFRNIRQASCKIKIKVTYVERCRKIRLHAVTFQ